MTLISQYALAVLGGLCAMAGTMLAFVAHFQPMFIPRLLGHSGTFLVAHEPFKFWIAQVAVALAMILLGLRLNYVLFRSKRQILNERHLAK